MNLSSSLKAILFFVIFFSIFPSTVYSTIIGFEQEEQRKTLDSIKYFSGGGITVSAYIKFDSGKKEIADSSRVFLQKIAEKLTDLEYEIFKKSGERRDTIFIDIIGHTDNKGPSEKNRVLSMNRAISVYNFLIEYGFSEDKMRYRGFGEKNPKYSNKDSWGRWHNRRVDLVITRRSLVEFDLWFIIVS